jgi:acyl-CoA synthetase (NDP forming)
MFFPVIKTQGPMAIISQSGSVTAALSEWAADEGLGISAAINLGNQVDLCESDYLNFLATDKSTKAIAMYIEGVKNGAYFIEAIKRVVPQKPIVILKGGRTEVGRKSAASHTGSMAGSHQVFSAACRQFGVVRVDDLEALYDCAKALATMWSPAGNRILTISTSGGAGTLGADEAEGKGLVMPDLPPEFVEKLKGLDLPPLATVANPFDMASIFPEGFRNVAILADKHDLADIIILSYGDPVAGGVELATELDASLKAKIAVTYFGGGKEEQIGRVRLHQAGIPVFSTPERAIRGIAAVVWDSAHRQKRGLMVRP